LNGDADDWAFDQYGTLLGMSDPANSNFSLQFYSLNKVIGIISNYKSVFQSKLPIEDIHTLHNRYFELVSSLILLESDATMSKDSAIIFLRQAILNFINADQNERAYVALKSYNNIKDEFSEKENIHELFSKYAAFEIESSTENKTTYKNYEKFYENIYSELSPPKNAINKNSWYEFEWDLLEKLIRAGLREGALSELGPYDDRLIELNKIYTSNSVIGFARKSTYPMIFVRKGVREERLGNIFEAADYLNQVYENVTIVDNFVDRSQFPAVVIASEVLFDMSKLDPSPAMNSKVNWIFDERFANHYLTRNLIDISDEGSLGDFFEVYIRGVSIMGVPNPNQDVLDHYIQISQNQLALAPGNVSHVKSIIRIIRNVGGIHLTLMENDKARQLFSNCLEVISTAQSVDDQLEADKAYCNARLGETQMNLNEWSFAEQNFKSALVYYSRNQKSDEEKANFDFISAKLTELKNLDRESLSHK